MLSKPIAHTPTLGSILFSAYGTNANEHMSALAIGLLFGNEDKNNWSKFWDFVKRVHPCIATEPKTILTDQDKGSIGAMKDIFEFTAQFMRSFHCRQNLLKTWGGGKGLIVYSSLWVYNYLAPVIW
jgi:hypothetical protein